MNQAVVACGVFVVSVATVCDARPGGGGRLGGGWVGQADAGRAGQTDAGRAVQTESHGPAGREEKTMTIRIGQTTIWRGDEYSIAVSYVIEGKYRNAAGEEKTGPVAGLVILRAGTRDGEGETYVDVGAGSEFRLGDRVCRVLEVVRGGGEGGYVVMEMRQ